MERIQLAPNSTTAQTHAGVNVAPYDGVAFEITVVAASGTPALTYKIQGSLDDPSVLDANAHWYDVGYITDASDTIAVAAKAFTTPSTGEAEVLFLSNPVARHYRRFRVITSVVTTTTYKVDAIRF